MRVILPLALAVLAPQLSGIASSAIQQPWVLGSSTATANAGSCSLLRLHSLPQRLQCGRQRQLHARGCVAIRHVALEHVAGAQVSLEPRWLSGLQFEAHLPPRLSSSAAATAPASLAWALAIAGRSASAATGGWLITHSHQPLQRPQQQRLAPCSCDGHVEQAALLLIHRVHTGQVCSLSVPVQPPVVVEEAVVCQTAEQLPPQRVDRDVLPGGPHRQRRARNTAEARSDRSAGTCPCSCPSSASRSSSRCSYRA